MYILEESKQQDMYLTRKSQLNYYRAVPLFYQNKSIDFMLYKLFGLKFSGMRINEELYMEKPYFKLNDKLRGIREPLTLF